MTAGSDRYSILIIDDYRIYREAAYDLLYDHDRLLANSAEEGLAVFKERSPDITFLDIDLPDKNGLELLPEMKAHNPDAFIIMLTASRRMKDVENCKILGASGYIVKPFSNSKLRGYIELYHEYRNRRNALNATERMVLRQYYFDKSRQLANPPKPVKDVWKEMLQSWRILIAGRQDATMELLAEQLRSLGCGVSTASSSADMLQLLAEKLHHMAFIDQHLSEGTPSDLIRAIRTQSNNMVCVVMLDDEGELQNARQNAHWKTLGANAVLIKPVSVTACLQVIEHEIERFLSTRSGVTIP